MSRDHGDWSKLCPDLLRSIYKGLSYKDFHRARSVCSNWYSVSKTCVRPLYPWRIVLDQYKCTTLIYDSVEDQVYEIKHPGFNFSQLYVLASCSNWLLIGDLRLNFCLLNVFTREKIDLPSIELSALEEEQDEDTDEWSCLIWWRDMKQTKKSAVLWIDERTRDYVVVWVYKRKFLFTHKKGDEMWIRSLEGTESDKMVYKDDTMVFKDYKLYVLTVESYIKILDLSGHVPKEVLEENPYLGHRFSYDMGPNECPWKRRITVTKSGEVLVIQSSKELFQVFKMNLESKKWERVYSIGDEMLIFGHGVMVTTSTNGGCIYFVEDDLNLPFDKNKTDSGMFDLATSTITWAKRVGSGLAENRWFIPGYV